MMGTCLARIRHQWSIWGEAEGFRSIVRPLMLLTLPNILSVSSELIIPLTATIYLGKMMGTAEQAAAALASMFCNAFGISILMGETFRFVSFVFFWFFFFPGVF